MKRIGFCLLLILLSVCGCETAVARKPDTSPYVKTSRSGTSKMRMWGDMHRGLLSRIWTKKLTFRAGEPIIVNYEIKNATVKVKPLYLCGFWPNNKLTMRTEGWEAVKRTPEGQRNRQRYSPGGMRKNEIRHLLQPGEIYRLRSLDLTDYYEIKSPGIYRIYFLYSENRRDWYGAIYRNRLKIKILPAKAGSK